MAVLPDDLHCVRTVDVATAEGGGTVLDGMDDLDSGRSQGAPPVHGWDGEETTFRAKRRPTIPDLGVWGRNLVIKSL